VSPHAFSKSSSAEVGSGVLVGPRAIGEGWSNRSRQQRRLDGCDAVVVD
jgi:hypothetical protein